MKLLTIKQLAIKLNTTESWVRSNVFKKNIPYTKIGRHVRFDPEKIEAWIKRNSLNGVL